MHDRVAQIEAAPQALTMQLRLYQTVLTKKKDKKGKPIARLFKVDTVVNLRKTLDLTRHQTNKSVPLKYRLQAVTSHSGNTLNAGHYMCQMRTSNRTYKTNERRVMQTVPSILTEWPRQWPGRTMDDVRRKIPATRKRSEEFTPYVLTWVMTSGN
jgi:ubiquitin C-terminal hydrolase